MRLSPHLVFRGDCEAAFRFYERTFGGTNLQLFKDGDKVVHASLTLCNEVLAGADVDSYESPRGFFVLLNVDSVAQGEAIFNALAEGGHITMPLQKTFWSPSFGVVIDRYGIPWEISA